jgi:hypothetical protein
MKPRERKPQRPVEPLTRWERLDNYVRQNGGRPTTSRQDRRANKKANVAKLAAERSVA